MSGFQRVEGDRVYCHRCDHEWDRAHGGLQCPACESEFVEIVEGISRSQPSSPPPIPHHPFPHRPRHSPDPFQGHNPWAHNPDEDDMTTYEFNTGGGRGTFSFSTRTYTLGGGNMNTSREMAADEIGRNFETMLGNIMGFNQRRLPMTGGLFEFHTGGGMRGFGTPQQGHPPDPFSMLFPSPGQQRAPNQPANPFSFLSALLNPANAARGDTVFSQEAFDRVMTQLMEQNTSNAPGPASDNAIASLKKKRVDESMLGNEGEAECSICMDNVELGQEVTVLPCNHWFHGDCVISWLREHDTCPHCRKPITNSDNGNRPRPSTPRRPSHQSSPSAANPSNATGGRNQRQDAPPSAPNELRDARQRYYENPRTSDYDYYGSERPSPQRRPSERSQPPNDNGGGGGSGGGVAGWLRNRLPFSGQQ